MPSIKPNSVVVIGAGVTGLSTAFHLVEKGVERVVVIDKGAVGGGSSLQSGGIITMLLGRETPIRARAVSLDLFERFSRILDGYEFHQVGCLNLFTKDVMAQNAWLRQLWSRLGGRFEVLHGREITERFPDLQADDGDYGVLDLRSGYSEPHRYVPALKARLQEMGVEFREHDAVIGFDIRNDRLVGVETKSATLEADAAVCAVNAWANHVLSFAGFQIPYKNFVHERFVTKPFPETPRLPAVNDHILNGYVRPTDDNRLLLGSGDHDSPAHEMHGPDFEVGDLEPDPRALPFLKEQFVKRTPLLEGAEWDYHTVGLVSLAYDVNPVIGPVPGVDGLYVGTNFHSGGFAYNPVSGLLLAEHMVDGGTRFDTTAYSPSRFDGFDTEAFLSEPIMHSAMGRVRH
jgi:glycine/D-amino acid oxidase-like deaminating enzyme